MNPQQMQSSFDQRQQETDKISGQGDAAVAKIEQNRAQLAKDQQEIAQWQHQKSQPQQRTAQKTQADFNNEYQRRLDVNDYIQQGRAATDANNKARAAGQPLPYQGNENNNYAGPMRNHGQAPASAPAAPATPSAAPQQPSAPSPVQINDPYMQAQQSAMKAHPELAQAGSAHNKAFLSYVNQNGGAAALKNNPALMQEWAEKSKPSAPPASYTADKARADREDAVGAKQTSQGATAPQEAQGAPGTPGATAASTNPGPMVPIPAQEPTNNPAPVQPTAARQAPVSGRVLGSATRGFSQTPAGRPATNQNAAKVTTDSSGRLKVGSFIDDVTMQTIQQEIQKRAESGDAFSQGILTEFDSVLKKKFKIAQEEEEAYLGYLNTELKKMAADLGDTSYTHKEIDSFTRDLASFEKAASEEASRIWEGLVSELRKQGADEAFIEGMTKEAVNWKALANIGRVAGKLNFGELGSLGKGVFQNIGKANATERALARSGKALGGLTDVAGNLIHSKIPHMEGSRSLGIAEHLHNALPNLHATNPEAAEAIKKLRTGATEQFGKALASENKGVLDKAYLNTLHDAEHGAGSVKIKAEGDISKIHSGDYSPLGQRGGFDHNPMQTNIAKSPSAIPLGQQNLPEALDKMKGHAGEVIGSGGAASAPSYLPHAETHIATGTRTPAGGSFWKGIKGGVGGALTGSLLGPVGTMVGGTAGLLHGLGPLRSAAVLGGGYLGGKKLLNGLGVGGAADTVDDAGLRADRHRVVPFMSNKATGAVGGALLAMMMAREMGLEGPAGFLAPVLGGLAGYHYLPELMNKWKDPYGSGANQMNPFAAAYNRAHPVMTSESGANPIAGPALLPPPPTPSPQIPTMMPLGH